jgi:hypothetical protein
MKQGDKVIIENGIKHPCEYEVLIRLGQNKYLLINRKDPKPRKVYFAEIPE